MMRSDRSRSAIVAVLTSFVTFYAASAIISCFFPDDGTALGAVVSSVPYLFGFLGAFAALKLLLPYTYDPSAEEEQAVIDGAEREAETPKKPPDAWLHGALYLLVLLAVNFAFSAFSRENTLSPDNAYLTGTRLLISAAIGVAVKPFFEELLFRRFYLDMLIRRGNISGSAAVLLQAVLFAAIHRGYGALFALFAGALLGHLAAKHSFRVSLAVHAAYNLILYALIAFWC